MLSTTVQLYNLIYTFFLYSSCFAYYFFGIYIAVLYSRPDLIEYDQLLASPGSFMDNLNNAFKVAEQELGLPQLLDPEGNLVYFVLWRPHLPCTTCSLECISIHWTGLVQTFYSLTFNLLQHTVSFLNGFWHRKMCCMTYQSPKRSDQGKVTFDDLL